MKKKFTNTKTSRPKKESSRLMSIATAIAFGIGAGLISLSLLLLVSSAICLASKSPHSMIYPLSLFCIYASAFLTGLFAAKRNHSSLLLVCGALGGLGFALCLYLLFLILGSVGLNSSTDKANILLRILIIPSSICGAMCSLRRPTVKKRKKY